MTRKKASLTVYHSYIVGCQSLNTAGYQMRDCRYVQGADSVTRLKSKNDRSGGFAGLRCKKRLLGRHYMYSCVHHTIYHLNALGKFFLQCPLEINVLNEWADADFFIIKYFISTLLAFRKSLLCHIQAELVHFFFWNIDGCPAVSQFVCNTLFADFLGNLGRFFG